MRKELVNTSEESDDLSIAPKHKFDYSAGYADVKDLNAYDRNHLNKHLDCIHSLIHTKQRMEIVRPYK